MTDPVAEQSSAARTRRAAAEAVVDRAWQAWNDAEGVADLAKVRLVQAGVALDDCVVALERSAGR